MTYLHGIQIKEGARRSIITTGDTSIIALVGTASKGTNEPMLITSLEQGVAEYGASTTTDSIPSALEVIFRYASAKIVVINLKTSGVVPPALYSTTIDAATKKAFIDAVTAAIRKTELLENKFGLKPNILIVPGYSHHPEVMTEMKSTAIKLNGFAVVDLISTSVATVLNTVNSQETILCYPTVVGSDNQKMGLSVHLAGCKVKRDSEKGYWISPSNSQLIGVQALSTPVSSSITDISADTNLLNGKGIVTVFNRTGSGMLLWGNWTSAFPQVKTPEAMIAPRAVRMAIREALIGATLNYIDKTPTGVAIDMIREDVNALMRQLMSVGAIEKGECIFYAEQNPSTEIAQGKLTFTLLVKYAPSLELITFIEQVEF